MFARPVSLIVRAIAAAALFAAPAFAQSASQAETYLNANCVERNVDNGPQLFDSSFRRGVYTHKDLLKGNRTIVTSFDMRDVRITPDGKIDCLVPACIREKVVFDDVTKAHGKDWLDILVADDPRCRDSLHRLKRAYPTPPPYGE